jgi:hypothetical protein
MADIKVKYAKLAADALQLITIDNFIIDAVQRNDQSQLQAAYVTRAQVIRQIQKLAEFTP